LTIWIDFNADGRWTDDEIIARNRPVKPGIEVVDFGVPADARRERSVGLQVQGLTGGSAASTVTSIFSMASSAAATCGWDSGFQHSDLDAGTSDMVVFDDGRGPALFVAGWFVTAGSLRVDHVARWDGSQWSGVGGGTNYPVNALAIFDDGTGAALYAGGQFTEAGGVPAEYVAKWDGSHWSPLGSGTGNVVNSLLAHDDGSGTKLYVGGSFTQAGGITAYGIATWDGTSWSPVGYGISYGVYAMAEFGSGSVKDLYVGTSYDSWGYYVKKWNGSGWSGVGGGMNGAVKVLRTYDDGSGEALYAGGDFTTASGVTAKHVAKWNGSQWLPLTSGTDDTVTHLCAFNGKLFVVGRFSSAGGVPANHLATWDGASWSEPIGDAQSVSGGTMGVFDDGSGPALFVAANVVDAMGRMAYGMARYQNDSWSVWLSPMGDGIDGTVEAMTIADLGDGPALYVGGNITRAGGFPVNNVAKWDGTSWQPLGSGMSDDVLAMATFDDGTGPAVYAGGNFLYADGILVHYIAKWDGTSWNDIGGAGQVYALYVFDDGTGPALYVGGYFTQVGGGIAAGSIARWDGSSWSALGAGISGGPVDAICSYDDGSGSRLYVGGTFSHAGGVVANNIASWDGTSWSSVGGGTNNTVESLAVYDDGQGAKLYAGGKFDTAGGKSALSIASWDGATWSALGAGISYGEVKALAVLDEGTSPVLVAGGNFRLVEGFSAGGLAKWDGSTWFGYNDGFGSHGSPLDVRVLRKAESVFQGRLFVGGSFPAVDRVAASNIASWSCTCSGSTALTAGEWQMIGLPCSPTGATMGDIFGDDLPPADYDSRWVMYEWDRAAEQYTKLGLGSALEQGRGYWIRTLDSGQSIGVDGRPTATSCSASPSFSVVGCFSEPLNGSAAGRWNMIGHPMAYTVNWGDVRFVDDAGNERTPSQAEAHGVASKNLYTWNGSAYQTWDDVTPGMLGTLGVFEGQWVKAFSTASALRIPAMPASGSFPAPAQPQGGGEWLIRLIASSGKLSDPGNVFGRLADSRDGPDAHDLPEMAPFERDYLTIVFPHPGWKSTVWAYTTDFRELEAPGGSGTGTRGGRERPQPMGEVWRFEVRSGPAGRKVRLRWQGPAEILGRSLLVDLASGREIRPEPGGGYTVEMKGSVHRFNWIVQPAGSDDGRHR